MNANLLGVLIAVYQLGGRDAVARMITPPRASIERICKRTGADVDEAVAARGEWVEATVSFIEELAISDNED